MTEPAIVIEQLVKSYGSQKVLAERFAEHSGRADVGAAGTQRGGKDDDDPHSAGGATG